MYICMYMYIDICMPAHYYIVCNRYFDISVSTYIF